MRLTMIAAMIRVGMRLVFVGPLSEGACADAPRS